MRLSERGAALIKSFESCERRVAGRTGWFRAYRCPAGVLTIGWGHTNARGRPFGEGATWSRAECDAAFEEDADFFAAGVRERVRVELTQAQFDALVSLAYNVGLAAFEGSTLLRKLNGGDVAGAAGEFRRWTRGGGKVLPGLVRRRTAEAALFRGAIEA